MTGCHRATGEGQVAGESVFFVSQETVAIVDGSMALGDDNFGDVASMLGVNDDIDRRRRLLLSWL